VHDEVDVGRPVLHRNPAGETPTERCCELVATAVLEAEHRAAEDALILTPDHGALLRGWRQRAAETTFFLEFVR